MMPIVLYPNEYSTKLFNNILSFDAYSPFYVIVYVYLCLNKYVNISVIMYAIHYFIK